MDEKVGACIDCGHCTAVCPTGIDIRKGLQMECIHCTQCIDACDEVMRRIMQPLGLIRYSSQDALAGNPHSWSDSEPHLAPSDSKLLPLTITIPVSSIAGRGELDGKLEICDDAGNVREVALKLLGP